MADKSWMTDKKAAIPGLPPPEEDEVLEFASSAVTEDRDPDSEPEDRFLSHTASDSEEEGKIQKPSVPKTFTNTYPQKRQSGRTPFTKMTMMKISPSTLTLIPPGRPHPGSTTSSPQSEAST